MLLNATSQTRDVDCMLDPSQSIERTWARLATDSLFMPGMI